MNTLIKAIRDSLVTIVKLIDDGDCNISEAEADELVATLRKYTFKDKRVSKYQACKYLNISRATFDNYVSNGWIPKGTHQQGFKELSWSQKDLDNFKQSYKR
jgi:predicted DNA-binding transcriptional regulator AlpA